MGLKENFRQAARELLLGDAPSEGRGGEPGKMKDMIEELESEAAGTQTSGPVEKKEAPAEDDGPAHGEAIPLMPSLAAPRRRTVIAEGTVIHGPVEAKGGVEVYGEVQGDLASEEDVQICGKLVGDSRSRNIDMCSGHMQGNIMAASKAQLDEDSVLVGDVQASELCLRGKIKGDLSIVEVVTLEEHAVVLGNITAQRLSIAEGAALHGQVKIASRDVDALFTEDI